VSKLSFELRAERIITLNSICRVERLSLSDMIDDETPVAFLLPDEEMALDIKYDDSDQVSSRELRFGRRLQEKKASDELTVI